MRRPELHPRTAIINRTQKNASRRTKSLALSWLAEKFPQAFDTTQRIRPLKKGIMNDILAYAEEAAVAGLSKSKLREAVVVFTRRLDYLACLKAKEVRVDLLGNTVEHVTLEEAERAAGKIKKRIEKSIRNTKKLVPTKFSAPSARPETTHYNTYEYNPPIEKTTSYSQNGSTSSVKSAADIVVKHKTARQYDPNAIARLKEKLGLSRKEIME